MSKSSKLIEIMNFLSKCTSLNHGKVTINDDFTIDVDGNIGVHFPFLTEIPVQFGKITGSFDCGGCENLISLKGCPEYVGGNFYCNVCNKLVDLQGAPKIVGGFFDCYDCLNLKSLKGIGDVRGVIKSNFFKGYLKDYRGEL